MGELIRQAHARTPQVKASNITPLIRMVMLAAYEEAEAPGNSRHSAPADVYKQLQEQIRSNLAEAQQLQTLMGSERKDPLSDRGYHCQLTKEHSANAMWLVNLREWVQEVLVSASYELDDYISVSQAQLTKAEEEAKRGGGASEAAEKRRQMLYALSDVAKAMHDSAVTVLRKTGR
jgi:hypothetical protein